jgi:hypothetical protein
MSNSTLIHALDSYNCVGFMNPVLTDSMCLKISPKRTIKLALFGPGLVLGQIMQLSDEGISTGTLFTPPVMVPQYSNISSVIWGWYNGARLWHK